MTTDTSEMRCNREKMRSAKVEGLRAHKANTDKMTGVDSKTPASLRDGEIDGMRKTLIKEKLKSITEEEFVIKEAIERLTEREVEIGKAVRRMTTPAEHARPVY